MAGPTITEGVVFAWYGTLFGLIIAPIGGIIAVLLPGNRTFKAWLIGCSIAGLISGVCTPFLGNLLLGLGLLYFNNVLSAIKNIGWSFLGSFLGTALWAIISIIGMIIKRFILPSPIIKIPGSDYTEPKAG